MPSPLFQLILYLFTRCHLVITSYHHVISASYCIYETIFHHVISTYVMTCTRRFPVNIFTYHSKAVLLWIIDVIFVWCLLCFRARLFIDALWSPAGKGQTSWLSFVMSNFEFVTFPLVSWVRYGTRLYRFLIFVLLLTLSLPFNIIVFIFYPITLLL